MIENLASGLAVILSLESVLALLIGIAIGIVIGAIPGMSVTMGVALALPFTFTLPPETGILLLLGIYKGGMYGGSISAILIRAPGTAAASCTVLDGYPLAQRGQGLKALEMALYASCVADFISNLSLILLAGWLASFALSFGPPEFFALVVFSITIIAGVSGNQLVAGLASACLGILLATVGLDLVYGGERFVFGMLDLMDGLNFIPVLIGLFALPEVINHYTKRHIDGAWVGSLGQVGATFAEFRQSLKSILRGSFIGVVLGAIPGIGGAPAAFLSYSEAKRTSKHPERFGNGELEGVAAAEAGNNGVCGATFIPLLSLGIPGDVTTAVILGAFMIHGLRPGPLLFQQNIDMIYALFVGIMLSSVFLFLIGKASLRTFARVSAVPNNILYPIVLVLCVFGSYAVNNAMFDVLVMTIMGVIGYGMLKLDVPSAPFLIGFILGPLFEDNFRRSLILSDGGAGIFFRSPICWFFWALTAFTVVMLVRQNRKMRQRDPSSQA